MRCQLGALGLSTQGLLPLNMSSHVSQRPPSRPPSAMVPIPQPLSRPSSESSMVEQPTTLIRRQPTVGHLINSALDSDSQLGVSPGTHTIPSSIAPSPNNTQGSHDIRLKYPILWNGLLALKNDQVPVQMHFVRGNKDITGRALPPYSEENMQPLRITQRMRIDQTQLQALERKIQVCYNFFPIDWAICNNHHLF